MEITEGMKKRFYNRIERIPEAGCWIWMGDTNMKGYSDFYPTEKDRMRGHRFSWVLHRGEIPSGMHVLHKCDIPSCVNPDHLFLGTHVDNMKDRKNKGRYYGLRGEDNPCSKITWEQRDEIYERAWSGENQSIIAKEFGIDRTLVSLVKLEKVWNRT